MKSIGLPIAGVAGDALLDAIDFDDPIVVIVSRVLRVSRPAPHNRVIPIPSAAAIVTAVRFADLSDRESFFAKALAILAGFLPTASS